VRINNDFSHASLPGPHCRTASVNELLLVQWGNGSSSIQTQTSQPVSQSNEAINVLISTAAAAAAG